ncbi:MAG: preprotein translocase subunit YajC [Clostridia bacterium]|nr:preprotein translocase subunit YajC [Clostridia bacterium]
MTENDFKPNDRVVTSRGIYGSIVEINDNKAVVNINKKQITVNVNQLIAVNDKPYVVCYCTDGYNEFNQRITLPKQFNLFDFNDPLKNPLLDHCMKVISNTHKEHFTIFKIKF